VKGGLDIKNMARKIQRKRKIRITAKKIKGVWVIYKNGRYLTEETSKAKALDAVKFFRHYYKIGPRKWRQLFKKKLLR